MSLEKLGLLHWRYLVRGRGGRLLEGAGQVCEMVGVSLSIPLLSLSLPHRSLSHGSQSVVAPGTPAGTLTVSGHSKL